MLCNRRKKILTSLFGAVLGIVLLSAAAGAPAYAEDAALQTVGEEAEGAFSVTLKNETGQAITGLSAKTSEETDYPENMIADGGSIQAGESVRFCYLPSDAAAEPVETESGRDFDVQTTYDVRLTLEDGSSYQLSGFAFNDMEEASIRFEDGVAFVEYTSVSSGEAVSTKEQAEALSGQTQKQAEDEGTETSAGQESVIAQIARKALQTTKSSIEERIAQAEAEAAAQAAAEEAARQAAEAEAAAQAAAAQQAAQQQAAQQQTYEQPAPAPSAPPAQTTEGCLQ